MLTPALPRRESVKASFPEGSSVRQTDDRYCRVISRTRILREIEHYNVTHQSRNTVTIEPIATHWIHCTVYVCKQVFF